MTHPRIISSHSSRIYLTGCPNGQNLQKQLDEAAPQSAGRWRGGRRSDRGRWWRRGLIKGPQASSSGSIRKPTQPRSGRWSSGRRWVVQFCKELEILVFNFCIFHLLLCSVPLFNYRKTFPATRIEPEAITPLQP